MLDLALFCERHQRLMHRDEFGQLRIRLRYKADCQPATLDKWPRKALARLYQIG